MTPESMFGESCYKWIDDNQAKFIQRLREMVSFKGVSGDPSCRPHLFATADYIETLITSLGGSVRRVDLGLQAKHDPSCSISDLPLPPVILGHFVSSSVADDIKTVCVYCHYDVQPAEKGDGWNTEPFELTEVDGKLYGRGSTDDKGPLLAVLNAIEAYQANEVPLPVHVKLFLEGMEESGSYGMEEVIEQEKDRFLADVDFFSISDNYWVTPTKPCVTYGLRGCNYYHVTIRGCSKDLHSGIVGGTVREPMTELFALMSSLVDQNGIIQIPGIYEQVRPLAKPEQDSLQRLDFSVESFKDDVGLPRDRTLICDDKVEILKSRWFKPSLSIHGIEGAHASAGDKTVVPCCVTGKFSIRTVPHMDPLHVDHLVLNHLTQAFHSLHSSNLLDVTPTKHAKWWLADPFNDVNFIAARNANVAVHGQEPDLNCEGGSIPLPDMFASVTGKSVVLLPIGASDDGAHSQNEKFNVGHYMNGIKVLGRYFTEIANVCQKSN